MSDSSKTLVKPKHADLALEWARQYAEGELQAGWWEWQFKRASGDWDKLGYCKIYSPNFNVNIEYRCIKTEKHPQYDKHAEVKADWEKVKDKGTHEMWTRDETRLGTGKEWCLTADPLWLNSHYEIRKIEPKLKLLDIRKLPKYAVVSHICTPDFDERILSSSTNQDIVNVPCLDPKYNEVDWHYFQNLRLREQKDWQVHLGGDCPVPEGVKVSTIFRDGSIQEPIPATDLIWNSCSQYWDIIAYRITGLAEGWTDNPTEAE